MPLTAVTMRVCGPSSGCIASITPVMECAFRQMMTKSCGAEFGWIVGAARMHHVLLVADQKLEPVGAHGGEMRAARHQADIGAGPRELHSEITADRAGAVNADFHGVSVSLESGLGEI